RDFRHDLKPRSEVYSDPSASKFSQRSNPCKQFLHRRAGPQNAGRRAAGARKENADRTDEPTQSTGGVLSAKARKKILDKLPLPVFQDSKQIEWAVFSDRIDLHRLRILFAGRIAS